LRKKKNQQRTIKGEKVYPVKKKKTKKIIEEKAL
jgi:hypothetical protein